MNAMIIKGGELGGKTGWQTGPAGCLTSCVGWQKSQKQDQTFPTHLSPYHFFTTVIKAVVKVCGLFRHFLHPGDCGHGDPGGIGLDVSGCKTSPRRSTGLGNRCNGQTIVPETGLNSGIVLIFVLKTSGEMVI